MARPGRTTVKKLASLSALGAGALALAPNAEASIISYTGAPITLILNPGDGPQVWHASDAITLPAGIPNFGFSLYECHCSQFAAAVFLGNYYMAVPHSVLHSVSGNSYPFL